MTEQNIPTPEMQALCSLTPGGSEFANDVDACMKYVRGRATYSHKAIVSLVQERNTLRNSHDKLVNALEDLAERLLSFQDTGLWNKEDRVAFNEAYNVIKEAKAV